MTIKLDHINLSVSDLTESIKWYSNAFGFKLVESGINQDGNKWGIVAFDDYMICMTEKPGKAAPDKAPEESVHQIYHFGIRVSDLEEWQNIINRNQIQINYDGEINYPSSKSWYVSDPTGHEIEVSYAFHGKLQFPTGGTK